MDADGNFRKLILWILLFDFRFDEFRTHDRTRHIKTKCKEIPNIYAGHHCRLAAVYLSSYRQQLLRVSPGILNALNFYFVPGTIEMSLLEIFLFKS